MDSDDESLSSLYSDDSADDYVPKQNENDENGSDDGSLQNNSIYEDTIINELVSEEQHENEKQNDLTIFEMQLDQNEDVIKLPAETKKRKIFPQKVKVTRKRQKNIEEWKAKKRAKCRESGLSYTTEKGELKPAKTVNPGILCNENCRYKCSQSITQEERESIFTSFYRLDINAKNCLLFKSIKKKEPKRKKTGALKHKSASYQYSVTSNGRLTTVCKRAFISLFGISMKKVDLIQQSIKLGKSAPEPDRRGKHTVRPNKTPADVAGYVIEHISSFPADESHYSRHCNIHKKYLSPLLSIPRMHKLYLDKCQNDGKDKIFLIKEATYRFIFNNEFNLTFGNPKSDTCSSCDSGSANEEHTENYRSAFDSQKVDREYASNSEDTIYVSLDLQQTMPLPRLSTSKAFYLRQMWFYNLGIHVITKNVEKTIFCTWTENQASRGSSEIFSCFLRAIEVDPSFKGKNHLILWTDSCSGQNKNFLVLCLFQYLVGKGIFKTIDHKFPEVGHSYLDSDRAFGRIEKRLRKHQNIFTPEEYREVIASSSKKNIVIDMQFHFRDTENVMKNMKLINRKKDLLNEKVHFKTGIKWIRVEMFGSYLFKESYDYYTPFKMVCILKQKNSPSILPEDFHIPRQLQNTGSLSKEKIENLKEQICFVPEKDKWYYETIIEQNMF